jgi:ATP-dependent Clp protease adapter protein ClpS
MSQQQFDRSAVPPLPAVSHTNDLPHVQPRNRQLPPYRVILLNNSGSDMMFVVRTIMELTRLCRAEATHKMWEAHHVGRSQLLLTHKERAELYVEQFAEKGLMVTIEPA